MNKKNMNQREVTLDGMMTIGMLENGLKTADFLCCEDIEVETFLGRFKVQAMHNGNMYMQELPKRTRNKPLFRLENSSLTLGHNGIYYFQFRLAEDEIDSLPQLLLREARQMANRVSKNILNDMKA